MQTARYVNVAVWFYLLVSGFLDHVVVPRGGDYWTEKVNQMFSLTQATFNGPYMLGRAIPILVFWFIADTTIRRVYERQAKPTD
jgi:hypothetical protein